MEIGRKLVTVEVIVLVLREVIVVADDTFPVMVVVRPAVVVAEAVVDLLVPVPERVVVRGVVGVGVEAGAFWLLVILLVLEEVVVVLLPVPEEVVLVLLPVPEAVVVALLPVPEELVVVLMPVPEGVVVVLPPVPEAVFVRDVVDVEVEPDAFWLLVTVTVTVEVVRVVRIVKVEPMLWVTVTGRDVTVVKVVEVLVVWLRGLPVEVGASVVVELNPLLATAVPKKMRARDIRGLYIVATVYERKWKTQSNRG